MKTPVTDFALITLAVRKFGHFAQGCRAIAQGCRAFFSILSKWNTGLRPVWRTGEDACVPAINAEATDEPGEITFGTAVNVAPIDEAQDDWINISPYGEFPNPLGTQVVDREAADSMVTAHNSFLGKLGRLFRGVPIYRGHPYQRPDLWPDDSRYGRVNALQAREDGLYGQVAWNDIGKKNKEQGYWVYPSPGWHFQKLGDGKIKPRLLDHIGLTNKPNIFDAVPLTNAKISAASAKSEQPQQEEIAVNEEEKKKLCEALGLDPAKTTTEQVITAINSLKSEKDLATNADKNPLVIAAKSEAGQAEEKAKKFKDLAINAQLDRYTDKGVITAGDRKEWQTKFETDFEKTANELKDKQPALNTKPLNLQPNGKDLSNASTRRIAFNSRIDQLFRDGCKTIDEAIAKMRANEEDAALLKAMDTAITA